MSSHGPPPVYPACDPYNPAHHSPYDYQPSLAAGIIFTTIFGLSVILHTWQAFRARQWWLVMFVLGALGEALGWGARAVAWRCVYSSTLFEMQISLLIFSPAFTTAGIYSILVFLIPILGAHTSPLPRRLYLYIFVTIDFISLLLQAIGGGTAASAAGKGNDPTIGTNIMIAGIVFQLVSLCAFATLFEIVVFRGWKVIKAQKGSLGVLCAVTLLSTACVIVRGIYRSIELVQGWGGYLMQREGFAIGLDGAMISIAVVLFVIWNPAFLLRKASTEKELEAKSTAQGEMHERVGV